MRVLAIAFGSLTSLAAAHSQAEPPLPYAPPPQQPPQPAPQQPAPSQPAPPQPAPRQPTPRVQPRMTIVEPGPKPAPTTTPAPTEPVPAMEPPSSEAQPEAKPEQPLFAKERHKAAPHPVDSTPLVVKNAPPPLIWKWPTFGAADYVVAVTGGAVTLAAAIVQPRSKHSLSGGLWFDNSVRDALRARTVSGRYTFRDASDVGLSLAVSWPFMADALTGAWWYRGSREAAQEMALIDLETLAVSGALQGAANVLVSRERPYGQTCGSSQLPSDSLDCTGSVHYRSFFSGHSAFSFTGAALICIHHFENDLIGAPWDALSCVGGYAVAATTATFRVVSDVHYASDVLTGALLGTIVGYGVPLLHYRNVVKPEATNASLQLHLIPAPNGIGLLGIF